MTRPVNEANALTDQEKKFRDHAAANIVDNALEYCHRRPAMSTLLEEMAEAILASRGKHDGPLTLEIVQVGGICINILWQIYSGQTDHVCNIGTKNDRNG